MITRLEKFLNENKSNNFQYELNRLYEYDELSQEVKDDIDAQFEDYINNIDETPTDYYWQYVILQPDEIEEFVLNSFGVYNIGDVLEEPYMQKLIEEIKNDNLKNPPVGVEGSHRALAHWYLKKPMPYLQAVKKEK